MKAVIGLILCIVTFALGTDDKVETVDDKVCTDISGIWYNFDCDEYFSDAINLANMDSNTNNEEYNALCGCPLRDSLPFYQYESTEPVNVTGDRNCSFDLLVANRTEELMAPVQPCMFALIFIAIVLVVLLVLYLMKVKLMSTVHVDSFHDNEKDDNGDDDDDDEPEDASTCALDSLQLTDDLVLDDTNPKSPYYSPPRSISSSSASSALVDHLLSTSSFYTSMNVSMQSSSVDLAQGLPEREWEIISVSPRMSHAPSFEVPSAAVHDEYRSDSNKARTP